MDKTVNTYGTQMIHFCKASNMLIVNGRIGRHIHNAKYTCKDKSVIDYYLCSPSLFDVIRDFNVLEFSSLYSDAHCPISLGVRIKSEISCQNQTQSADLDQPNAILWNPEKSNDFLGNFNVTEMRRIDLNLTSFINSGSIQQYEMDDIVTKIGQLFEKCAEKSFGCKRKNKTKHRTNMPRKPWFKGNCHIARNQYHNARRLYNLYKTEENKQTLKHASKFYKNTMNLSIRKYRNLRIQKLRSIKTSNPREFWKLLNSFEHDNTCKAPLHGLYDYFKSVNDYQENARCEPLYVNPDSNNEELNRPISECEVRAAIKQLNNNKSAGLDNIKNEHIKYTACHTIPIYTKLFNLIFDTAIIPESWSVGVIKPIYKKGDPKLPQNYRPITILSCLGKLFTSVINNRLREFADKYDIIESCQAGFREKHSSADNIFIMKSLIDMARVNKSKLFTCFIDFKQAFDTVWRTGLWYKLNDRRINGKCLAVIQSIYKNVKSKVATHEGTTMYFPCLTGVRQGENLSPFLFSIYVNDLNHFLMSKNLNGSTSEFNSESIYIYLKIMILLYADDTVLFSDSEFDMQRALDHFYTYCNKWQLTVNVEKTKIVVFSGGKQKSYRFLFNGLELEVTNDYKYLGIWFTRGGSFLKAKTHLVEQANKAIFSLLKKIRRLNLPLDMQLELFDKTIKPILLYGAEIWGFGNCDVIERVHLKYLKYIFKLKKSTPSHMIYGELGIFPLTLEIRHKVLSYWCKTISDSNIETLGTQKLSTYVYSLIYNMQQSQKLNSQWLSCVKEHLCKLGFSGIWENQNVNNIKWLTAALKQKLHDQYIQEWLALSDTSSSSMNYRLIKNDFERSRYFQLLPDFLSKKMLAFRTRNHRLPVEVGRWTGTPLQERKCEHCNADIGDEFHYVLRCDFFQNDRKKYVNKYFYRRTNIFKYNELMNTTNDMMLKKLALFICKILKTIKCE
ncbi:MAG: reverse transcriptase family protein [Candidatus Thiodiazotropha endolucinida]|nr:reverse transcriptase family protein [Candidatus Thiodiazotropha endolucinida]